MAQWLGREFTNQYVRGSNPNSASRLLLPRLGQPGSIAALVLPSGGTAARKRNGVTAERVDWLHLQNETPIEILKSARTNDNASIYFTACIQKCTPSGAVSRQHSGQMDQSNYRFKISLGTHLPQHTNRGWFFFGGPDTAVGLVSVHHQIGPGLADDNKQRNGRQFDHLLSHLTTPWIRSAVARFRGLTAMPPEGCTRAERLPGCPSLDRGSREADVGFEPWTCRSNTEVKGNYEIQSTIAKLFSDIQNEEEGSPRAGILPGCPNIHRGSREVQGGFKPRTFRSVNSRSNHLGHLGYHFLLKQASFSDRISRLPMV
ncbi:hypothetical protein T265_04182 [Opisthorchis viverrini]|uniref:Uncharacterized protein n=1 Tax=Opisthorchis viverrini TaxID=6198 RepID=A0A074ZNW9_OPIVI|nr:hypothetical protein T265_04182 [Opisthorchis viverrini]KER29088.1 hypothetical protein T265_04182 [Opisthorchis viverrini]